MLQKLNSHQIVTYWDQNTRKRNQAFIDDLYLNMTHRGYDDKYPVKVYQFEKDPKFHLADGHHRYEAAVLANIGQIPVEVVSGTSEDHIESMCLDNMQFDVSRGDIGQIFSAAEKREAIKRLLLLPKWWGRSDRWIAEDFGLADKSINRYRESVGATIVAPSELNLSQEHRVALETEILKRERVSKDGKDGEDGQVQPVTCKTADLLEKEIKQRVYKDMQDPDITMQDNAWTVARVSFNHLPAMSVEGLTTFRRNMLRQLHPDRVKMEGWNAVRRETWTVFFNMLDAYSLSLIEQYTERAEVVIKSGGIG